jgi:hypothetical protein
MNVTDLISGGANGSTSRARGSGVYETQDETDAWERQPEELKEQFRMTARDAITILAQYRQMGSVECSDAA